MCSVRIFNNIACLSATVANSQTYNYNMTDLRNLGIAAIAVATFGMPCSARKNTKQPTPATSVQAKAKITKGLFDVSQSGNDWSFSIPDSLLNREFLVTVRFTSTPGGTDKYGGELANQQTVYFQKVGTDKLLLRSRLLINTADSADKINRAVVISNSDPIIATLKIDGQSNGKITAKVSPLFLEDNSALGIPRALKAQLGLQAMLPGSSYIESIKTFPLNTEIRTVKTWASSTTSNASAAFTGKVTVGLNTSFVLLPKVPMQRRLFDPRVGYFTDDFTLFSDNQQRVEPKRFITRWRLEPKDSADAELMKRGILVEPRKPIVYYIDPATPKQWRPYLIQGVNDWQKAFEQAGFKNAIMAKEWPENDSTMSMEDARYSCIRYLASPIENAYGPNVHDPRSGEILESHICWYHNVMTLVHDWYMIQAGTLDEAAQKMKYDTDLMGQLIRFVSSHEVGHTLGLRHNFGSSSTVPVDSLRSRSFVIEHGHTPSIMDYARFNYVAQPEDSIPRAGIFPRIGDYDCWAIEWGYKPMFEAYDDISDHWELEKITSQRLANNRRLWFGDGETNRTNDARCQTEDLGDDAMKASYYGMLNLKRELKVLPEWTYQSGDIYGSNLSSVYTQVINQYMRYCMHVMRNLGGVYYDYKTVDEAGSMYTDEPRAKQERAFRFLCDNVIAAPQWLIDQPYISRILPSPQDYLNRIGTRIVSNMSSAGTLRRLTSTYPVSDYLPALVNQLFATAEPSAYLRALQNETVENLIAYLRTYPTGEVTSTVYQQLTKLQRKLDANKANAHYQSLAHKIACALVVK